MGKIYRYQAASDAYTTYRATGENLTELCEIDGLTYLAGPDELPPQPPQISIEPVTLTAELRERIKAASPHCHLIQQRMEERIREKFSAEHEIYLTRIGVGQALGSYQMSAGELQELIDYQAFVEEVRAWGREQRAGLGL